MTSETEQFPSGPTSASGRIKVAEKDYDVESKSFAILFADGSKSDVSLDKFTPEIVTQLALHGLSQVLGDSYAGVKGDVGKAKANFEARLTTLLEGKFKSTREGGEGGARIGELAEAIATFKGIATTEGLAKVNAAIAGATDEQIKGWKANAKIKAIIAEIRARKAAERAAKAAGAASAEGAATDADLEAILV